MKKNSKRFLSVLLSLCMLLAMILPAYAETVAAEEVAEVVAAEEIVMEEAVEAVAAEAAAADDEEAEAGTGERASAEAGVGETAAMTALLGTSSIGDLWEGWDVYAADDYKPAGSGTEASPYVITTAANLMWLSVNTVARTAGVYDGWYQLGNNIDLAAVPGFWHPIGWYANKAQSGTTYLKAFEGHFDGCGHTISGLYVKDTESNLKYAGLFGYVKDAEIKDLTVSADTVSGTDYIGVLAGRSNGMTTIKNVTVSGYVTTDGAVENAANIGGMVGYADGGSAADATGLVMENCVADGIEVLADETATASIGGLIGYVSDAYLVDVEVQAPGSTSGGGVKGIGYVGGIAGTQTGNTRIYNSKFDGLAGGSGALAIGGITGLYDSGEIILAQMHGSIGNSGIASHEGIIAGNYKGSNKLIYSGTSAATGAYLWFNDALVDYPIVGSGLDQDMRGFTKEANIGYFDDNELKFTRFDGTTPVACGEDEFYYEALENGVRYIVVSKLDKDFTVSEYAAGLRFAIDHYAPGDAGKPVRGYLVSIPRIDAVNSTTDLNVASLTAKAGVASMYYKLMTMNTAAAVEPGTIITVNSSANDDPAHDKYYQRVVDETVEPEKVKRPTYTDSTSGTTEVLSMDYKTGGAYTFTMPECDTELNIEYEKVLSKILTDPKDTTFTIVETRTGDRKNPSITWKITDANGHTLCNNVARTRTEGNDMKEQLLSDSDVTPVDVAAVFNSVSLDNKVEWSIDDTTLLSIDGTDTGYTENAAKVKPEVSEANTWMLGLINTAELDQKNAGYTTKIPATVYTKKAVLTATTDPAHTVGTKAVTAHCEITLSFKIDDQTTLKVEGVGLDKDALTYTVTRKLTGNRRAPLESWTVTGPQSVKASVNPADAYTKNVTWEITGDAATSVSKTASGDYDHDLTVTAVFDGSDPLTLPAWMAELYAADNAAKSADKNYVMSKSGSKTATLTVTAEDKDKGVHQDTAAITVNYVTVDETPDVAELTLNTDDLAFTVTRTLTGDRKAPTEEYSVTSSKKLTASLSGNAPFLENVLWSVDSALEPATVRTLSGTFNSAETIGVNFDPADIESAPAWIFNAINADNDKWTGDGKAWKRSASAIVEGYITAKSNDVTLPDGTAEIAKCKVTITFVTDDQTVIHPDGVEVNPVSIEETYTITHVGDHKSDIREETGFSDKNIAQVVLPNLSFIAEHLPYNRDVEWSVSDTDAVSITQDGKLSFNRNAKWIRDAKESAPYAAAKTVSVYCTAKDNGKVGVTTVKLIFKTTAIELPADAKTIDAVLTASGPTTNVTYTWSGIDGFSMKAENYPAVRATTYTSSDTSVLTINATGAVSIAATKDTEWVKEAMRTYPYTAQRVVTLEAKDPLCRDSCVVTVNFKYENKTYTPNSGGGGGGGGVSGGGAGGGGSKPTTTFLGLPTYVIGGTWREVNGLWSFANTKNELLVNCWAAVVNPYATGNQPKFDWFAFDPAGNMRVGWFNDSTDGNTYYLSAAHDGMYGHMYVGFQHIDGFWFYFNNTSNGARGALIRNGVTQAVGTNPAGLATNAEGKILAANGRPVTDPAAFVANENSQETLALAGANR